MSGFAEALLDPGAQVPAGLTDPAGRAAGRRFDVYRNNVVVSLVEAMAVGFPVIQALVGEEFFAAMAAVYVRAQPPRSPVIAEYGETFPRFLQGFEPVAHLPYLADVARLEWALRAAYHAADAAPIAPEELQVDGLENAVLRLAPACRVIASPYPIHAIWRANTDPGAAPATGGAETVFVARPRFDPEAHLVDAATGRFIAALAAGQDLGTAVTAAGAGFALVETLGLLLRTQSITAIEGER